jgi:hypothetical protein
LGIVGGIEVCDILEKPGVAGDLRDDCEDCDVVSARDEFIREPEVVDADLSLREKSPIVAVEVVGFKPFAILFVVVN